MPAIYLTSELTHREGAEVIYYFFAADDRRRSNAAVMLRSLISQSIQLETQKDLLRHLRPRMSSTSATKQFVSTPGSLWTVFTAMLEDLTDHALYFVIDGLDECVNGDQGWIAERFINLGGEYTSKFLRVAIVSRPLLDLQDVSHIDLDAPTLLEARQDVHLHIATKVEAIARRLKLSKEKKDTLEEALAGGAQHTFLWVGFVAAELSRKKTYTEVLRTLATMPGDLYGLYCRMLKNIDADNADMAAVILRWVLFASRPLEVRELASLLQLGDIPLNERIDIAEDHITLCGGILRTVDVELDYTGRDDLKAHNRVYLPHRGTQIELVHESARDFLLQLNNLDTEVPHIYRFDYRNSQAQCAEDCLLSIAASTPDDEDLVGGYPWYDWPMHARKAGECALGMMTTMRLFDADNTAAFDRWWTKAASYHYPGRDAPTRKCHPIHVAAYFGIFLWVKRLLTDPYSRGQRLTIVEDSIALSDRSRLYDGDGGPPKLTALYYAMASYHVDVVVLLLAHGAEPTGGSDEGSMLQHVVAKGTPGTARLLLDYGIDVNATSRGTTNGGLRSK
ncbi:hypothetical protein LTR95_002947 [Oleoguttula sp. CCFEE 5521]